MARRMTSEGRSPRGPRRAVLLGWLAAAAAIALLAFIVGRPDAALAPSPEPEPSPQPIDFGTRQNPETGEALDPTDRFGSGDTFAYSLVPDEPIESDTVTLEIFRVQGEELISEQVAEIDAGPAIGLAVSADAMLDFYGAGEFVMRIYLDPEEPLGEGRFTLVESPEAT